MRAVDSAAHARRERIRHLGRLATRLAVTWYRDDRDRNRYGPIFEVGNLQAFRAAFVEVSYGNPFEIREPAGATEFVVCGKPLARLSVDGELELLCDNLVPHSLAPSNIDGLAQRAFNFELTSLATAYERRAGHALVVHSTRGGYSHSRPRSLAGLAVGAVKDFCAHLAPDRLGALRHAAMATSGHARSTRPVFGPNGWKWIQAIRAYPVLMNWVTSAYIERTGEVAMAVEGGRPLVPALASSLGLTEAQVRRFRGLTPQRVGPYPGQDVLKLIAALPQHLWPTSRKQWRAAADLIGAVVYAHGDGPMPTAADLFRGVRGPIEAVDPNRSLGTLRDPALYTRNLRGHQDAIRSRLVSMTIAQLMRFNREWHRRHEQATLLAQAAAAAELRAAPAWRGCLDDRAAIVVPGVDVRELTTPAQLNQEAVDLGHCVGGYSSVAYRGVSRIVSLTCATTGDRSTLELVRARGDATRLEARQHYGRGNSRPPGVLERAAATVLLELNSKPNPPWPVMADHTPAAQWSTVTAHMDPWLLEYLRIEATAPVPKALAA